MRTIKITLLIITISLNLISCEKHRFDKDALPPLPYSIVFSSPLNGQTFRSTDSVRISGVAIYSASIHGYDIKIREANDTSVKYFAHIHEHNDTLRFDHKWKSQLVGKRNMEAEIVLYLDHEGNTGSARTSFGIE